MSGVNYQQRSMIRYDSFRSVGTFGSQLSNHHQRSFRRLSISKDEASDVFAYAAGFDSVDHNSGGIGGVLGGGVGTGGVPTATVVIEGHHHDQTTTTDATFTQEGMIPKQHQEQQRGYYNEQDVSATGRATATSNSSSRSGVYRYPPPAAVDSRAAMCNARDRARQRQAYYQRGLSNRSLTSSVHSGYLSGSNRSLMSSNCNSSEWSSQHERFYCPPPPNPQRSDPYCRDNCRDNNNNNYSYEDRYNNNNNNSSTRMIQEQQMQRYAPREGPRSAPRDREISRRRSYTHEQYSMGATRRGGRRNTPARSNSDYGNRAPPPQQQQQHPTTYVEIMPGVEERLRSSSETLSAIENDFYRPVTCFGCSTELLCLADASYVLCPDCRVVSPMDVDTSMTSSNNSSAGGVGMGFKYDDLFRWQSEIVQQRQQQQQQR